MTARLAKIPYRAWLLIVFLIILVVSMIHPRNALDMSLEHIPTAAALIWMAIFAVRRPLSNLTYTLVFMFLLLHTLGAHYLYSDVPYDDWSKALFGRTITDTFGFSRNHYDRLVHFSFGLLITPCAAELAVRSAGIKPGFWAAAFGVGFVSLCGNVYEVIEWIIALMSEEAAVTYNGQQGDMFDAAKDMALNFAGAVISGLVVLIVTLRRNRKIHRR